MAWVQAVAAAAPAVAEASKGPNASEGTASMRGSGLDGSAWSVNFGSGAQTTSQTQNKSDAGDRVDKSVGGGISASNPLVWAAGAAAVLLALVMLKRKKKG